MPVKTTVRIIAVTLRGNRRRLLIFISVLHHLFEILFELADDLLFQSGDIRL